MLISLIVLVGIAVILAAIVLMRRGGTGRRGNLLGPPPGMGSGRPAPPSPRPTLTGPGGAAPAGDVPEPVAAEARRLVAQGQKVEAIKLVREARPGWSLGHAKDWVERL